MTLTNISTYMIGKITTLFCFAMVACTLNVYAQEPTNPLTNGVLFYSPCEHELENGYQVPHRIPAIVKSRDTVIVFADKRYSGGDVGEIEHDYYGHKIDTKIRKSGDDGETWTKDTTIAEGNKNMGYGDVAVVADRENSQNIVYFCVAGKKKFTASTRLSTNKIYRFRSNDGGVTWTNEDITTKIYNTTLGLRFDGAFFSSGNILQSSKVRVGSHYRLYAAIHTHRNILSKLNYSTTVVYSDDFGETWKRLGTTGTNVTITDGNEAKCQELPNGDIVVSCRAPKGRIFNIYHYKNGSLPTSPNTADGEWIGQAEMKFDKDSYCNDSGTNGEFLIIKAFSKGVEGLYALQSMPAGPTNGTGRSNLAIYYKKIGDINGNAIDNNYTDPATFASGWKEAIRVSNTTSAYSSMTMLDDTTIGFVYEEDYLNYGSGAYDIKFKKFNIEEIVKPGSMLKTMAQSNCDDCKKYNYSWATFFFDQNMTLPKDVTAYVATTIDDRTRTIKIVDIGDVVPANTPVILIDKQNRPTIYLTYGGTFDGELPNNGLVGAKEKIEVSDDVNNEHYYKKYYVVGHGSRHVGLYYPSKRGIASGLAYYPLSSAEAQNVSAKSSYGFVFAENTTTGIENIKTNTSIKDNTYYNLSGQAVKNPTKGIYILNGKKVIIK